MKKVNGLTNRIAVMLLSGMLIVGLVPGTVLASENQADIGQTSKMVTEEVVEMPSEDGLEEDSAEEKMGAEVVPTVEEMGAEVVPTEEEMGSEATSTEEEMNSEEASFEKYCENAADQEEKTITSYTVTLDANGGYFANEWDDAMGETVETTNILTKAIPIGGVVSTFPVREQDNNTITFLGWSLERDGELVSQGDEEYIPVDNCVLYAVWQADEIVAESEEASWGETDSSDAQDIEFVDEGTDQADTSQEFEDTGVVEETEAETENADPVEGAGTGSEEPVTEEETEEIFEDSEVSKESEEAEITGKPEATQEFEESDPAEALNVEQKIIGTDIAEETETVQESEDTEVKEETEKGNVEEDRASDIYFVPEIEDDNERTDQQAIALNREAVYVDEDVENTLEDSSNAAVAEEFYRTLSDPSEDEETVREDAAKNIVKSGKCGKNLTWTLDEEGTLTISGTGEMENYEITSNPEPKTTVQWPVNSISTVIINNGVTSIGNRAFEFCSNLTSVSIPNSVTRIGNFAFECCSHLVSVSIPNSVTRIGDAAFGSCTSLKTVDIPNSVVITGSALFHDCNSLTDLTIPGSIKSIKDDTFCYCSSLTNVTIQNGITSIGDRVFYECSSLVSVTIPDTVTSFGEDIFGYCDIITLYGVVDSEAYRYAIQNHIIFIPVDTDPYPILAQGTNGKGLNWSLDCAHVLRISGKGEIADNSNASDSPWSEYYRDVHSIVIEPGITYIGSDAFRQYPELAEVSLCEDVVIIGQRAFEFCDKLKEVKLQHGLKRINSAAFRYCINLISIIIPNSVTNISDYAFENCESLTNITVPGSVTSNGYRAFSGCCNLISVTIEKGVTTIGFSEFSECRNLTSVTIPNSVSGIGHEAFYNCTNLTNIFIPETVEFIGDNSFFYYDNHSEESKPIQGLTISGYSETAVETYAKSYNIPFKSLSSSISGAIITIASQTYNGKALTPATVVYINNTKLKLNTDYTVAYSNNTNAGTATATITGKLKYRGTKKQTFTINKATQYITASNVSLTYLKTGTITVTGNKGKLSYKSSNTAIATVDTAGKVTAKGAGTAKITITAAATSNYKSASKTITVTVVKAAQSITAKAAASSVAVGKTTTVSITGAKGTKSFKSSDTTIATVTSAGKVTAKKVGTVKITATSSSTANYKAASKTVTIKVVPAATSSLTAVNQVTGIKLTWKKVTGANGYKIYRGTTLIKTITSGSTVTYADTKANTNGTKYVYKVVAKASTGDSTLSKSVTVYRVARPAISSVTNSAASRMTVKWGKNSKTTGYQIQYSQSTSFASGNKTATITAASTVSKVIGSLTKSKTYYVRIRSYKTVGSTKYWSAWSAAKSVKISK